MVQPFKWCETRWNQLQPQRSIKVLPVESEMQQHHLFHSKWRVWRLYCAWIWLLYGGTKSCGLKIAPSMRCQNQEAGTCRAPRKKKEDCKESLQSSGSSGSCTTKDLLQVHTIRYWQWYRLFGGRHIKGLPRRRPSSELSSAYGWLLANMCQAHGSPSTAMTAGGLHIESDASCASGLPLQWLPACLPPASPTPWGRNGPKKEISQVPWQIAGLLLKARMPGSSPALPALSLPLAWGGW